MSSEKEVVIEHQGDRGPSTISTEVSQLKLELERLKSELSLIQQAEKVSSQQLLKSEERFALAMRSARDGLWDWDLETSEVYYSPRWKHMLGYESAEFDALIRSGGTMLHPEEREYVLAKVHEYISGNSDFLEVEMRMRHKDGHFLFVRSRGFKVCREADNKAVRLVGTFVDITRRKQAQIFDEKNKKIVEMIAKGEPAKSIYIEIALLYEARHPGLRCSMLELSGNRLLHGGAPSLPQAYCDAVHGLENGPDVGSCGTSTYTGKRVVVENIETDPKWAELKDVAMPFGMRCCWSEPIVSSRGVILGAFGMYYDFPARPDESQSNDLISAARLAGIVMEREQNQRRIQDLAYTDELTGLNNRRHFYSNITSLLESSSLKACGLGFLYVDLDNFKNINDSLGHDVGDLLLSAVSQRLQEACREHDYIARLSGDEFCIVLNDMDDPAGAEQAAVRCLGLVSQAIELAGRRVIPTCSIGIACFPEDGKDVKALLKAADTALYAAKDLGKNCFARYQASFTESAVYRFKLEQALREAVEFQSLSLVYQPKIDVVSGDIVGLEALSRWNHPKLGAVSPTEFIDIAEQIGMIKPLTLWVLTTACQQVAKWREQGLPRLRMAVNISPSQFLDEDMVPMVERVIRETGIAPEDLELEVTESVVQTNANNVEVFQRLRNLGVQLSIDDFGTGFSSFASLKHLDVDFIKIDKVFIHSMVEDEKSKILVESMIDMAHKLGHAITAEGVETQLQYDCLRSMNCDSAQGFLMCRPIAAEKISRLLGKWPVH